MLRDSTQGGTRHQSHHLREEAKVTSPVHKEEEDMQVEEDEADQERQTEGEEIPINPTAAR